MDIEQACLHDDGSSIGQRSRGDAEQLAARDGRICFFPLDDELLLDLDGNSVMNTRVKARLAENGVLITRQLVTTSAHGNKHMYLKVDCPLTALEKTVLQAALGSDPVKEALTMLRLHEDCDEDAAIALFETPQQALRVAEWRASK